MTAFFHALTFAISWGLRADAVLGDLSRGMRWGWK